MATMAPRWRLRRIDTGLGLAVIAAGVVLVGAGAREGDSRFVATGVWLITLGAVALMLSYDPSAH
jgi:hypothetical protein